MDDNANSYSDFGLFNALQRQHQVEMAILNSMDSKRMCADLDPTAKTRQHERLDAISYAIGGLRIKLLMASVTLGTVAPSD